MTSILEGFSPGALANDSLQKQLDQSGRLPPVQLVVKPLDGSPQLSLTQFLSYSFNSNIMVPVDSWSFNFAAPDDETPFPDRVKDGDICLLIANGQTVATGLIDMNEVETDGEFGEKISVNGRDLMGQLEDQDAISFDSKPMWSNNYTVNQAAEALFHNTRIAGLELRDAPRRAYLFATEPAEKKLAALQRFLEPLNCIAWMGPSGKMIIGRPNMAQKPLGTLILSRKRRTSNVLSMRATRSATQIGNIIVPIWSGQETVADRVTPESVLYNAAAGPSRLRKLGHRVPKTVVVSTPQGADPQELSGINALAVAGGSNILQAYAKRLIARENQRELIVQAVVPGHFNEAGVPYQVDQVYKVEYDRGGVDEAMYLFGVDWQGSEEFGQKSILTFCRLGTIVSDVRAP